MGLYESGGEVYTQKQFDVFTKQFYSYVMLIPMRRYTPTHQYGGHNRILCGRECGQKESQGLLAVYSPSMLCAPPSDRILSIGKTDLPAEQVSQHAPSTPNTKARV